jgi:ERCC4-type nuclease
VNRPLSDNSQIVAPFTVVVDTREQLPFAFAGIRADAVHGRRPVLVRTVRCGLPAGDYSLAGFELSVAIERKSLADLFSTLGQARARFVRELQQLDTYAFAAVVVEAGWEDVLARPPARSRLNPKTIWRSVIAWEQRYPRIHWHFLPGRSLAEVYTFRALERFWKDWQAKNRANVPPY